MIRSRGVGYHCLHSLMVGGKGERVRRGRKIHWYLRGDGISEGRRKGWLNRSRGKIHRCGGGGVGGRRGKGRRGGRSGDGCGGGVRERRIRWTHIIPQRWRWWCWWWGKDNRRWRWGENLLCNLLYQFIHILHIMNKYHNNSISFSHSYHILDTHA